MSATVTVSVDLCFADNRLLALLLIPPQKRDPDTLIMTSLTMQTVADMQHGMM